jgi:hypothetical protein
MDILEMYKKFDRKKVRITDVDGQVFEGKALFDTDYETDKDYIDIHYEDKNYITCIFIDEITSIELI